MSLPPGLENDRPVWLIFSAAADLVQCFLNAAWNHRSSTLQTLSEPNREVVHLSQLDAARCLSLGLAFSLASAARAHRLAGTARGTSAAISGSLASDSPLTS